MERSQEINYTKSPVNRIRRIAAGVALTGVALGCGTLALEGSGIASKDIAITAKHAEPSNESVGFTLFEEVGEAIGAYALAKRGLHSFKIAINQQEQATYEVAHSSYDNSRLSRYKIPRSILAAGLLTVATGIVGGNDFNIANNVGKTDSNVAGLFGNLFPNSHQPTFVISDNPTPNLIDGNVVNGKETEKIERLSRAMGVVIVPALYDWGGGAYNDINKRNNNLEFLMIGLPNAITHIPKANPDCSNVEANVSSALGVKPGDLFELQGINVRVNDLIKGNAGFDLLPVVLNSSDYERCLLTNNSSDYNMLIAQGSEINIDKIVSQISDSNKDDADRLYVVSTKDFINNAENAGKNEVNGLVLEAIIIGMALGAIALSYKTSQELANNRSRNRMLEANGYDKHMIMKIYGERAEAGAIFSAMLAMPGTLLVDTLINSSQPGGALGISLETYLAVTGFLWTINKISNSIAVRREAKIMFNERSTK